MPAHCVKIYDLFFLRKTMFKVLVLLLSFNALHAQELFEDDFLKKVATLRDKALTDSSSYDITESLTTEVDPRLGGSAGDGRAVK